MSDETTLLPCPFCEGEATVERIGKSGYYYVACNTAYCCDFGKFDTETEAIAAWNTRAEPGGEPPYDELLRCLENDWHISASWDGLRKFWCIELTEEGIRMCDSAHGTLTAEQVREAIESRFDFDVWVPEARWQAIADELNAAMGCDNRVAERLRGIAADMRNIGASSMTPRELFVYWARQVDKAADMADFMYDVNPDGLPCGLTISDDSTLLNWRGENYVKQSTIGSGVCENVSDQPSGFLCSECGWGDFSEPSHLLTTAKFTDNDRGPNYCPNCGKQVKR